MKEIYTAVIPVRAGSRRIKNKNILPFGNTNLLIHKIRQLKQVPEIDQIVVSSDSPEMLEMARSEGVMTQERPLPYADEVTKSFNEVVEFVVSRLEGDHILWTPCVCPLFEASHLTEGIHQYKQKVLNDSGWDSLVSVKLTKEYFWDEKKPLNYIVDKHVPSQQLPNWYSVINGLYIASKKTMVDRKYFFGLKPYLYEVDKIAALDIDDEYDLEMARAMYQYLKNRA